MKVRFSDAFLASHRMTMAHNCHGETKSLTAKANHLRQKQIAHGKSKSLMAKANPLTAKANSLTARANRSWQNQMTHGKKQIHSRAVLD